MMKELNFQMRLPCGQRHILRQPTAALANNYCLTAKTLFHLKSTIIKKCRGGKFDMAEFHYRQSAVDYPEDPLTLAENAAWRLAWEQPRFSAHSGISAAQRWSLFAILLFLSALVLIAPRISVLMLGWTLAVLFTFVALFRCVLLAAGVYAAWRVRTAASEHMTPGDAVLPVYTVLVPLYREPGSVPQLVAALTRLDYPADRLDIKLVLEADDEDTFAAIQNLDLPVQFEVLRVPALAPRTKPKACNYALASARGAHVVIYDAEDIPDTDQLRKAAAAFRLAGPQLACLQARLNYYNPRENWLTRQFTLEYSMWFDWLLPGLQALGLPIPLGGTSNHFRTCILRQLGGWDAYNVTEDADLGLRLARAAILAWFWTFDHHGRGQLPASATGCASAPAG